ncbi:MAG TPA: rhamnogalacturonan acetylesterase, partial [Bryobacteraceae bacterium]|nr:rhamnogalacturonan acetylesterase [Bryobacteraceae bacterium]
MKPYSGSRVALLVLSSAVGTAAQRDPSPHFRFDFGQGKPAAGYTKITPDTVYTTEAGYGFEQGSTVNAVDRGGDPLRGDFITADRPFFFSVAVPEGHYRVTVTLGDKQDGSRTTVKAELRRLMLERFETGKGKVETRTFLVDVRRPQISTGGEVALKDREKNLEAAAWDDKLTLEFNDKAPKICALEIAKITGFPVLYIAGDSTSTDQPREPFNSWGQMLPRFLKPDIVVANHGESGESLRSFIGERRLAKLASLMKRGDWLLIQMGHNDQKQKGAADGAFTSYKAELKQMIEEARTRGVTPILVTSMHRRTFGPDGKVTNSLGDYPEAVRQTAKEEGVALIDLQVMSQQFYEALGPERSALAFAPNDGTHHNNYGSYQLAKCIVEGIRAAKLPLARHVIDSLPGYEPG